MRLEEQAGATAAALMGRIVPEEKFARKCSARATTRRARRFEVRGCGWECRRECQFKSHEPSRGGVPRKTARSQVRVRPRGPFWNVNRTSEPGLGANACAPWSNQSWNHRGQARLVAPNVTPAPEVEGRGEGGRFDPPYFHEPPLQGAKSG